MSSHKRIQSDSSVPDSHLEGPYYYDSGDDEISLSDDKSIEALSDSDSDDYEIFMMSSKSDLRSQVSFMDTNEDETVKSKDGTKWSPSFVPFEERQFPKILHGIPRECNNFTSVIGLLNLYIICFNRLPSKLFLDVENDNGFSISTYGISKILEYTYMQTVCMQTNTYHP